MRGFRLWIILASCLCLLPEVKAQDAFFSQFYANRLSLNPSWAGIGNEKRVSLNYRNQYPGIGSTYNTYTFSYDQYAEALDGGIGFTIHNDIQGGGAINQLSFSGIYSYQFKAGRFLSFSGGLQATGVSRTIKASGFEFGDQYDPLTGGVNPGSGSEIYGDISKFFPDFSSGISGFYKSTYAGISIFHLLKPYLTESALPDARLPRKLILYGGTYIPVYEKRLGKEVLKLNPNLIFIHQKNLSQLIYGVEGLFKDSFVAGIWLRQNLGLKYSAIIFSGGFSTDIISVRYSYDGRLSSPTVNLPPLGSHEISMIITFGENKKIKHKTIKCPKF